MPNISERADKVAEAVSSLDSVPVATKLVVEEAAALTANFYRDKVDALRPMIRSLVRTLHNEFLDYKASHLYRPGETFGDYLATETKHTAAKTMQKGLSEHLGQEVGLTDHFVQRLLQEEAARLERTVGASFDDEEDAPVDRVAMLQDPDFAGQFVRQPKLDGVKAADVQDLCAVLIGLAAMKRGYRNGIRGHIKYEYLRGRSPALLSSQRMRSLVTKYGQVIADAFGGTGVRTSDASYYASGRGAFGRLKGGQRSVYTAASFVIEGVD